MGDLPRPQNWLFWKITRLSNYCLEDYNVHLTSVFSRLIDISEIYSNFPLLGICVGINRSLLLHFMKSNAKETGLLMPSTLVKMPGWCSATDHELLYRKSTYGLPLQLPELRSQRNRRWSGVGSGGHAGWRWNSITSRPASASPLQWGSQVFHRGILKSLCYCLWFWPHFDYSLYSLDPCSHMMVESQWNYCAVCPQNM